jgi:hypothetical protein
MSAPHAPLSSPPSSLEEAPPGDPLLPEEPPGAPPEDPPDDPPDDPPVTTVTGGA